MYNNYPYGTTYSPQMNIEKIDKQIADLESKIRALTGSFYMLEYNYPNLRILLVNGLLFYL